MTALCAASMSTCGSLGAASSSVPQSSQDTGAMPIIASFDFTHVYVPILPRAHYKLVDDAVAMEPTPYPVSQRAGKVRQKLR